MSATAAPATVGDYVIEREVGRGAFGVVYRAHHRARPDTAVALKVVEGRGDTDRLLLEPAVLSRLDHPCIVGLEDYFLRGSDLVLALEFVDGWDLGSLLEEGETLGQVDVRDLLLQIGSALAAAHARNVIHRDLKPANILVTRTAEGRRRFVLTDFGIGQVREGIQTTKHTGGTFLFMAPEQLRGRPGPQSDLWALGVVAYRLLTGRLPFPGPTLKELTSQILYSSPRPPSEVAATAIEPDLEKAVLRLLDRSLQERTASAEELLAELGHRGPPDSVLKRKARRDTRPAAAGLSLDRRLERGIARRKRLLGLCVGVYFLASGLLSGLLLLGGTALFFVAQRDDSGPRRRVVLLTGLSYLVLGGYVLLVYTRFSRYNPNIFTLIFLVGRGTWAALLVGVVVLLYWISLLVLPIAAGALFAGLRRLQREQVLRDLAREGDAGSDRYLQTLRQALDSRFEDVGLHLKYAEALFARGRVVEAAAECRILLRQDPYHFNGNLLLANAYHALGLDAECVELCDRYLEVSGYCFEFTELRQQALRRVTP